jgi:tubulin polyglutamylase TTLL6/13
MEISTMKSKKRKAKKKIWFASNECRYSVILNAVKERGWRLIDGDKKDAKANIYWIDVAAIHERFKTILPWQVINHFPGMPNIARKNKMGQNLNKMAKFFPKQYSFYPKTWVLPGEMSDFKAQFDSSGNSIGNKVYIIKPDAGCQGRGIFLTKTFENVPKNENVVAQLYVKNPLLLDGFKFDLRLYCLVTSVKPLRVYLFQDGLVRICTEEYVKPSKNLDNVCMHLTNYAVNKHNSNFQQPSFTSVEERQDEGNKRSLLWFMNRVKDEKGASKAEWLWHRMGTLCVRTILSILPTLSREYDQHFKAFNNISISSKHFITSVAINSKAIKKGSKQTNDSVNQNDNNDDDENEENDDDEGDGDDDNDDDEDVEEENYEVNGKENRNGKGDNCNENSEKKSEQCRGSRCFEILGFDVMITDTYKPVLIEVNHLPSFGTDSPLDLDIKKRLMKEVMSVISALPDDEYAFIQHQKEASEQRLIKKKEVVNNIDKNTAKLIAIEKKKEVVKKPTSASTSTTPTTETVSITTTGNSQSAQVKETKNISNSQHLICEENDPMVAESKKLELIKIILKEIYMQHRPDKVLKIEKLLTRYVGLEEQFLIYVHQKYEVPYNPDILLSVENKVPDVEGIDTNPNQSLVKDIPLPDRVPKPPLQSKASSSSSKRVTRSLSPPSSNNNRSNTSWKQASVESDNFRSDVIAVHVPTEDDSVIKQEMSFLSQFTRIYPPMKDSLSKVATEDDNDDGSDSEDPRSNAKSNDNVTSRGSITYEDIMYKAFVEDKRQFMRLFHPLAARTRPPTSDGKDNNSLPPLGVIKHNKGPTAPPKDIRKEMKPLSQKQIDAAQRLYRGMSVKYQDGVTPSQPADSGIIGNLTVSSLEKRNKEEKNVSKKLNDIKSNISINPVLKQQLFSFRDTEF